MRRGWMVGVGIAGVVGSALGGDGVYQYRDSRGTRVYTNEPGSARNDDVGAPDDAGKPSVAPSDADEPSPMGADGAGAATDTPDRPATAATDDASDQGSTASYALERREIEREYRSVSRSLREVEGEIERLSQARRRGNAAVKDIARGLDVQGDAYESEEELRLAPERDRLVRRSEELRKEYADLRTKAQGSGGDGAPGWPDLR